MKLTIYGVVVSAHERSDRPVSASGRFPHPDVIVRDELLDSLAYIGL